MRGPVSAKIGLRPVADQSEIRLIREALEGILSPAVTSSVLFEALDAYGNSTPQSLLDLQGLVTGPLTEVLRRRVGHREAAAALGRVAQMLQALGSMSGPTLGAAGSGGEGGSAPRVRPDATALVPVGTKAVKVLIVGSTEGFAARLASSLGPQRVAPWAAATKERLAQSLEHQSPAIVVIDATDLTTIPPAELARLLASVPSTTPRVVWGAELPYGRRVLSALEKARLSSVALDRGEGILPLLDLVRSRQTG